MGIDLAAQSAKTGVVVFDPVSPGRWKAQVPGVAASDEFLVELGAEADLVGVDAPLGWPMPFVAAVTAQQRFGRWPGTEDRRPLTHRHTDAVVRANGWGQPMSVSADKLGSVAMRCALLQREWASEWGRAAPRDGSGRLVEVYPAVALLAWGVGRPGYKGSGDDARRVRESILAAIAEATHDWLDLAGISEICIASDHSLDAVVSALNAVAAGIGASRAPESDEERDRALVEGWIHVPTGPLRDVRPR
ncbi:MAG: DUF429 domain-containing protein [Actinobacteria bacterium]|nr:DUF429 domain-containing protein [Actinomycetota bacterium]